MLDIHQLNVFLTAAETLNFTQAARRLHITQPSVSQRIQALERHFNDKLFVRSGRNLELTEAGLALLPLAREAVKLSVRIEETMESLHGQVYGHLQVGCSTTPGKYVLPHILARFHHKYPQVRVSCAVTSQSAAQRMLSDGDVHFALSSMIDSFNPEIDYSKFICDSVILIAPLDHHWADKGRISPEDLYQGEFIMREADSGTYTAMRDALSQFDMSVRDLHTLLTLGNSEAIALAVQEGLGVAFISEMVYDRLSQGKVARIDITGIEIVRDIYIARHMRRATTLAQNAFWDFIHSDDNPLQCLELGAATSN
jgi:DNA-binding transcriptional LysR family regulator